MITQHTKFVRTLLLPTSPSIVLIMSLLLLAGLAVYSGIEVIARCNEFLLPLILLCCIPLYLLMLKEADPNRILPILNHGLLPVLQGSVSLSGAFINQLFILGWLLPFLNQPKKAMKVSLLALLSISIQILAGVLFSLMILGPLTGRLTYSFLSVIQYIGIEGSLERLEAVAVAMWVMGMFVKVSVSLFILCLSVSQLFGIPNYRAFLTPMILLTVIGSTFVAKSGADLQSFLDFIYPSAGFISQSLLPLALLAIDTIKRRASPSLLQ